MSISINASDLHKICLGEKDMIHSVIQNIALILSAPKGSVPFHREFGLDWSALDKPMPIAKSLLIPEIREAIETWKPRATFVSVSFEENASKPGVLIPTVEVEINDGENL